MPSSQQPMRETSTRNKQIVKRCHKVYFTLLPNIYFYADAWSLFVINNYYADYSEYKSITNRSLIFQILLQIPVIIS